jgi:hypothetical protein
MFMSGSLDLVGRLDDRTCHSSCSKRAKPGFLPFLGAEQELALGTWWLFPPLLA